MVHNHDTRGHKCLPLLRMFLCFIDVAVCDDSDCTSSGFCTLCVILLAVRMVSVMWLVALLKDMLCSRLSSVIIFYSPVYSCMSAFFMYIFLDSISF